MILLAGLVIVHVSRTASWAATSWSSARARVQTVIGALIAGRLALPILVAVEVEIVVIEVALWTGEDGFGWCGWV